MTFQRKLYILYKITDTSIQLQIIMLDTPEGCQQ